MNCLMLVAADRLVPVIGRPVPPEVSLAPARLVPLGIETMAERRYLRLLAAFMQVRHATRPFAVVRS